MKYEDISIFKETIISYKKEITANMKEIRNNLKEYKVQIDIYKRMLDLSKAAFLYETTNDVTYKTDYLEYKKLELRLKDGYHKTIVEVDTFYQKQLDELIFLKAQRKELNEQYKLLVSYEKARDEHISLYDALEIKKAFDDVKSNIFATDEAYAVSKDSDYYLHVIKTPALVNGKRSIKVEIAIISIDGEKIDTISSDKLSRSDFAKAVYNIEKEYGFKEFEITDDKDRIKTKSK